MDSGAVTKEADWADYEAAKLLDDIKITSGDIAYSDAVELIAAKLRLVESRGALRAVRNMATELGVSLDDDPCLPGKMI